MTSLLDLPGFRKRVHPMSVETYHRLGELGLVSKNVEHFRAQVPREYEIRHYSPLTLRDSEPEADLSIMRGNLEDWVAEHPKTAELTVEVAVSSPDVDEGKADIYAEAGISEYWIVRADDRAVDLYRRPSKDGYLAKSTLSVADTLR